MKKRAYVDTYDGDGWPDLSWLESLFLTKLGQDRLCGDIKHGNDSWGLSIVNPDGREHLPERAWNNVHLYLTANSTYGVTLQYSKWDGEFQLRVDYFSKGNLGRLGRFVRSLHDDRLSLALFIPFEEAWKAVNEFVLTDGQLPTNTQWIEGRDLPPNTFPDPWEKPSVR